MTLLGCKRLLAISAAAAALGPAARVSSAHAQDPVGTPIGGIGQGGQPIAPARCIAGTAPGVSAVGGTFHQICGTTLVFVGPSIGQVATAIGPTIIGSTIIAPIGVGPPPVAAGGSP
jgi:hypothetical protein